MSDALATAADVTSSVPGYPMARTAGCPFAPPPGIRALVSEKPLCRVRIWDGSTPWLVLGHAEQRALLADPRVSVDERRPGFPHWDAAMAATVEHRPNMVFNLDPPEHTRLRRIMIRAFTSRRIRALRPAIQRIADDLVDAMLAGPKPADLVQALALPLPSLMISELLGVPYEDHEFFQHHSAAGVNRDSTAEQNAAAVTALMGYLARLVAAKAGSPGDDVVSDLGARVTAGEITVQEAALIGVQLLVAGHETSANMIALGTIVLLQHPDALATLRETDDPATIENATEELLRYLTIAHAGQRRVAAADIEIAGEVIHAGDGIIVDLPAGNWDPRVFSEPGRLDLGRPGLRHQAFGFGVHQCVGQQLARAELQITYRTLFRRIPSLQLATTVDEIEFKHNQLAFGVYSLPVTW